MMKRIMYAILFVISLLALPAAQAAAQETSGPPTAVIENDEGGPDTIFGEANYANTEIAITGQEPVIALIDMSAETQRDYTQFAGVGGQILGYLTTPLAPSPAAYVVPLPKRPAAIPVDLDNDGENDMGVQIFRLALVSNLNGGSHLEQLDQWRYLNSYQFDDAGEITEGAFLVYAPDDQQGFPSGVGEDGLIFTADDPTVMLPQGYTVARLATDGAVTFDRSQEANIDVLEAVGVAYPDFANQGILESYNSLIDVLVEEYAFTDLRQLDWEEIRATYLPRVEEAEAAQDVAAYGATLRDLAQTVRDAHVYVSGPGRAIQEAPIAANLGANVVELVDGRFVVTAIATGSPLEAAGVISGTEIVSIDGASIEERLPNVIYTDSTGTAEGQRLRRVRNLLMFPAGAEAELVYRLPDATETTTATLTAGIYPLEDPFLWSGRGIEAINYKVFDKTFGYVTWPDFTDPIPAVEGYADFLKRLNAGGFTAGSQAPGIIIDMRSNGGGWDVQYRTMGSYLFEPEQPLAYRWAVDADFDAATQTWKPEFQYDWPLSAPDPAAYFPGDVVILIDPSCGSSCEFFTAMLQSSGRATVVGQYASNGAGGSIKDAALPGGLSFHYPYTGVIFDGTNDLVLEAKGVEPDVRVPVTLASEAARLAGEDPVLAAGLDALRQSAAERLAATTLAPLTDPNGAYTTVSPEGWKSSNGVYLSPTGTEYITFATITPPLADLPAVLRGQGITDMAQQLVEERTVDGRTWAIYGVAKVSAGIEQAFQIAIAADETATYAITAVSRAFLADAMRAAVLDPAIDAFVPNSESTPAPEASAPATPAAEEAAAPTATAEENAAAAAEGGARCPARTFPIVEPDYTAKRPLDLSAFDAALAAFTPQRAADMDALLTGKNIAGVQELFFDGALTSVDLVTYYIDRIQRYDVGRLNAILELNPQALAEAAAADASRINYTGKGALLGIPVLLKDNIATAGMHTTAGAYALKDWMPERDAFLVQQLRADGAIILGKTNLSEWANYMDPCMPSGFSTLGGQTRNPYGPYETYGSSSGSGVATGANLATVAVGSETSGSLIQPARVNSIVGMRPSLGLISRDYVVPLAPALDTPGPMGRSVTDVALLLNALSGVDANDPTTANAADLADTDFTLYLSLDEARKVRVGVVEPNALVAKFLPAIQGALEAALGRAATPEELVDATNAMLLPNFGALPKEAIAGLTAQGIEYVVIDDATLPPDSDTAWTLVKDGFKFGIADFFAAVGDTAPIHSVGDIVAINQEEMANRAPYGQRSIEASVNSTTTPEEYAASVAAAQAAANAWLSTVLEQNDVDILVYSAFYATNAGAAGIPALTVPAGLDPNGRPQGIILTGPYLSDPQLIAVGYALEQALNGRVEPDLDSTISLIDATIAP